MEMRLRPDAVGGVCDTWDSSTYQPSRARRQLYSDFESEDESSSSIEYTNTFHIQQTRDSLEGQTLHHVNISPVDQSNFHIEARRRIRKQQQRQRIELRRSRELVHDSSSEFEQKRTTKNKSRDKSGKSVERSQKYRSYESQNSQGVSCSKWDLSEVTTSGFTKHEYRRRKGDDWEVYTVYPEPSVSYPEPSVTYQSPGKVKQEKKWRRKSVEWEELSSVYVDKPAQKKKAHSYEQKQSRYWDELSTIHPEKIPKNEYRERISKDYYEPTIPVVTKYDPSVKSGKLKAGMTSTCTKRTRKPENINYDQDINWGELSSIYPERDIDRNWTAADSTPRNLADFSSIHPAKSPVPSVCPTLVTESEWSDGVSALPSNPNNTLVSSVLLQHGGDPNIRNTDGKTALDLADPSAKAVLSGRSW